MRKIVFTLVVLIILIGILGCSSPQKIEPNIGNNVNSVEDRIGLIDKNAEKITKITDEPQVKVLAEDIRLYGCDVLEATCLILEGSDTLIKENKQLKQQLEEQNVWLYRIMNLAGLGLIGTGLFVLFFFKSKNGLAWIGSGLGAISLAYFLQNFILWLSLCFGVLAIGMIIYMSWKWWSTEDVVKPVEVPIKTTSKGSLKGSL